jgi:twinkle protein
MIIDLARMYRESSLIIGFEQTPEEHIIKLSRKMIGSNITYSSWWNDENEKIFRQNYDFITEKIQHIDVKKHGGNIEKLLLKAAEWIQQQRKKGANPRYVVVDPFNMLSNKGKMSGYEKAEEILRQLTHFSHQMDVLVILVAHPFKMQKDEKTGEYNIPDFYSVKGSSAFFEMSYHGLTIYRTNGMVLVRVLKVKQNNLGDTGADVWFMYDKQSGRYIPCDEEGSELAGDHRDKNWLNKVEYL